MLLISTAATLDSHPATDEINGSAHLVLIHTVGELKQLVYDLDIGEFIFNRNSPDITFIKLTNELNTTIQTSVVIYYNFIAHLYVFGKRLNASHNLWQSQPVLYSSRHCIE